jgi:dipeptidyl aminopeptidase/acylaminoacyl peptidase
MIRSSAAAILLLLSSASLFAAGQGEGQPTSAPGPAAAPLSDAAARFGARENVEQIDLSPGGGRIAYLTPGRGGGSVLLVHDIGGSGEPVRLVASDGRPDRMTWCRFVTDDRLICQLRALLDHQGDLVPFARLVSIDARTGEAQQLGERSSFYDARLRQFDGAVIDWLPGGGGSVLMTREAVPEAGRIGTRLSRTADGLGVVRIDAATLRLTQIEPPNSNASSYMSDGRGHVRIMRTSPVHGATGQLSARSDYYYRQANDREWRLLGSHDELTGAGPVPLAVDAELDAVYVLEKLNGRDALYRISLDGSMSKTLVFAHERVDVDGVVRLGRGSRIVGAAYAEERRHVAHFDADHAALVRSLGRAVPGLPMIDLVSASDDGNKILVHAGSDADPGRYFLYDRAARRLSEILVDRPELEGVPLATVRSVSYPSGDGATIPAYLTLPPGSGGRGLPTVVLPHGGPSARDVWGFDWLAQYLAHRGYAVLQPNYRGSAGYGDQWLQQNGFRSWRTSIGDIAAGARWLAAEGIADPRRTAIVGWSYGGYAALQAGATEPDLFRAIVAIAPVTDLQQAKDDFRGFSNARNVAQYIGDGPHIAEGSPARHAAQIRAPVLLFHGERDRNVPVIHSERMHRALRGADRQSELVRFPDLEHDLADGAARARMLAAIGDFLDARLARQ